MTKYSWPDASASNKAATMELQGETDRLTIIIVNFNLPLSIKHEKNIHRKI